MPARRGTSARRSLLVALVLALAAAGGGLTFMIGMPGRSHRGPLPPLGPGEQARLERLRTDVHRLAGEIGERHLWRPAALEAAARHLEETFDATGLAVAAQPFEVEGRTVRNVEGTRRGARRPGELVVVGAHYDSVTGSPGANDNATGVAALLELARALEGETPARTIRFVGFVNEEPPFFQTPDMGSLHYAQRARVRGEAIVAMISIETIGAYSDEPGSQQYPLPLFGLFYPDAANFIAFVANVRSRPLVRRAIATFRRHAAFPSEGTAAPGWIDGIGWSDHWAFWQYDFPAIMVTDTALFRYPPYHTAADTPDRIDYEGLTRVVSGLVEVVRDLANE